MFELAKPLVGDCIWPHICIMAEKLSCEGYKS